MTQDRINDVLNKLSQSGHRITKQRREILTAVLDMDNHPTAEQIHERVLHVEPMTSLATIYKTLDMLKESGEVVDLGLLNDRHHYDRATPTPHAHIVCSGCGKIDDIFIESLLELADQARHDTQYQVHGQTLTFSGMCPSCQLQA